MFISTTWHSPPSRLLLTILVSPFVLGWVFYFLSDILVFHLDPSLFSVIHHLKPPVGGGLMLQKLKKNLYLTFMSTLFEIRVSLSNYTKLLRVP